MELSEISPTRSVEAFAPRGPTPEFAGPRYRPPVDRAVGPDTKNHRDAPLGVVGFGSYHQVGIVRDQIRETPSTRIPTDLNRSRQEPVGHPPVQARPVDAVDFAELFAANEGMKRESHRFHPPRGSNLVAILRGC